MASKSKQEEALQFLDDLDSFTPVDQPKNTSSQTSKPQTKGNEAEVLAFIDEITQKSTEPTRTTTQIPRSGTPTMRKSTERVRLQVGTNPSASSSTTSLNRTASTDASKQKAETSSPPPPASSSSGGGGWGWGTVWSTASAAIQQAKSAVDEQVKHLPKNDQVRHWGEGVLEYAKSTQLDKLGQDFKRVGLSTLTDILIAVAPPISEHEVIHIWLSHDMQGYDGVETVVYRSMSKVMEQVKGGDLVVNRGNESKPKEGSEERDLNAVEGYDAAVKVSQVNVESMVKSNLKLGSTSSDINSPTTYSNVYIRVQPFFMPSESPAETSDDKMESSQRLQFLIYLHDPEHNLINTSVTQGVSSQWLSLWDEYDWVEDLVADALRLGVEVIGQEYLVSRMSWAIKGEAGEGDKQSDTTTEEKGKDGKPDDS